MRRSAFGVVALIVVLVVVACNSVQVTTAPTVPEPSPPPAGYVLPMVSPLGLPMAGSHAAAMAMPAAGTGAGMMAPPGAAWADRGPMASLGLPEPPSGFLLGSPVAITTSVEPPIRLKSAGFEETWSYGPEQPDFRGFVGAVFPALEAPLSPILAMSLGIDVIVAYDKDFGSGVGPDMLDGAMPGTLVEGAVLQVGAHGWYALEFTVDKDQIGASYLDPAKLAPDIWTAHDKGELDATVFSYLLPDSDAVMLPSESVSVRAMEPGALGLGAGDHIFGLNMHMALYGTDLTRYDAEFTQRAIPDEPWLYFTLRPGFLTPSMRAALQYQWALPQPPDPGTIYRSQWQAGLRKWTRPEVYRTSEQLGIPSPPRGGEVVLDGIAIDTNPELGSNAAPEILFSLANTATLVVEPEEQVMYVRLDPPPAPPKPRRAIVRTGDKAYGSLGVQLGGGRGIGDFCTKDPFVDQKLTAAKLPDDYFVARRLGPQPLVLFHLVPHPAGWPAWPFPGAEPTHRPFWPGPMATGPWLPVPATPVPAPAPTLAVSGYRQFSRPTGHPFFRTCMSWPRPKALFGTARVRFGRMDGYYTTIGATIDWGPWQSMPYLGRPLVADCPLPDPRPGDLRAMVAEWQLEAIGQVHVSPISALRY